MELEVAQEIIAAWNTLNWRKVADLFTEDGVMHQMMLEPVVGRERIYQGIVAVCRGIESMHLDVRNIGVINGQVFIERVDRFVIQGHPVAAPVVGVLEIQGGRVKEWRDYYDRAHMLRQMGRA